MDRKFVPVDGDIPETSGGGTIALLPAGGDVWEDFLDSITVPLDRFCAEGPGGWMVGYMDALNRQDIRVVLIFFSARVARIARYVDPITGNSIVLLPVPQFYRSLRRRLEGHSGRDHLGNRRSGGVAGRVTALLHVLVPHLSTPLRLLVRELRRWRCQAILCQEYENFRFDTCVALGRLLGLPVFATFQGADHEHNPLSRVLKRITVRRAAGLFIAAETEIARVGRVYGKDGPPVVQVFNPVDVDEWRGPGDSHGSARDQARAAHGIGPTTRVAVWHGRIEIYSKGLDLLLPAWEQVCRERPGGDLRLMLMGTGSDEDRFSRLVDASSMRNIRWVNEYVTDRAAIHRFLTSGNVFVFPSRLEGFPVAPLEAMACGLPVVAADASGIPDILRSGEASGGLVLPREDVYRFASALGRVLDDPDYSAELGRRAQRRVQEAFSLDAVGEQLRAAVFPGSVLGGKREHRSSAGPADVEECSSR